jgi:hypothetical protein
MQMFVGAIALAVAIRRLGRHCSRDHKICGAGRAPNFLRPFVLIIEWQAPHARPQIHPAHPVAISGLLPLFPSELASGKTWGRTGSLVFERGWRFLFSVQVFLLFCLVVLSALCGSGVLLVADVF